MAARNIRTADYPEDARRALASAVADARRRAGFRWRPDFARAHPEVSLSSLKVVEQAKPLAGVTVLQAIGTALGQHFPNKWTKDTPRAILEGVPAPALSDADVPLRVASAVVTASPDDPEFWVALRHEVPSDRFDHLWGLYLERKQGPRIATGSQGPSGNSGLDRARSEDPP